MTAREPKYTSVHCSVCGRKIGKRPGIQVALGLICDAPICNFQPELAPNEQRDALIVASTLARIPVSKIAAGFKMSRQRVYQVMDAWKEGV